MIVQLSCYADEAIFDLTDERDIEDLRETIDLFIKNGVDFRYTVVIKEAA